MGDAPERIWVLPATFSGWGGYLEGMSKKSPEEIGEVEYVRADALTAAQKRIAELEAALKPFARAYDYSNELNGLNKVREVKCRPHEMVISDEFAEARAALDSTGEGS